MKKPAQHFIAEVPRSITKVGMTIGIDLGDVWISFCSRTGLWLTRFPSCWNGFNIGIDDYFP